MTPRDRVQELPPAVLEAVRELETGDVYVASEALLARIQESRGNGARGLLPLHDAETTFAAASWWRIRGGLLAAGLAAIAAIAVWRPSPSAVSSDVVVARTGLRTSAASPDDTNRAVPAASSPIAELLSPWPRVAYAQTPQGGRAGPFAPLSGLRPERVKLGRRAYVRLSGNAYHELLPHEYSELEIDTVQLNGIPALRLVTQERARMVLGVRLPEWRTDTLWLERATLQPIIRRYEAGALRVVQRFTDTSLVEVDSMLIATPNRRPFRMGITKRLDRTRPFVASESMLRVLLQSVPLTAGWRGSVGVLDGKSRQFALGTNTYRNLRVAGVDTVQTFSGRFAAWRVEIDTGVEPERWYVSQETGEVLMFRGPYDPFSYPKSESHLISGFSERNRLTPVKSGSVVRP